MSQNLTFEQHKKKCEQILRSYGHDGVWPTAHINGESFTKAQQLDACKRVYNYALKNKKLPDKVWWYNSTTNKTSTTTTNGWVLTGTYKGDKQDTSYTCGPSSVQMVFSALGKTVQEAYIAQLAGTGTSGTSHEGLAGAVKKIDSSIKITEYSYSDIGISGLASKLKGNCEFIIHLRTGQLTKDAYGNRVWSNDYGHYIFLVGVNTAKGLFRVFDPTKGLKDFTTAQIKAATAAVTGQNSFICHCK